LSIERRRSVVLCQDSNCLFELILCQDRSRLPRHASSAWVSRKLKELIERIATANPLWGAPRVHAELLELGITISQRSLSRAFVEPEPELDQD
jgi:hypothetical protein